MDKALENLRVPSSNINAGEVGTFVSEDRLMRREKAGENLLAGTLCEYDPQSMTVRNLSESTKEAIALRSYQRTLDWLNEVEKRAKEANGGQ